jgi:hypothetical protein
MLMSASKLRGHQVLGNKDDRIGPGHAPHLRTGLTRAVQDTNSELVGVINRILANGEPLAVHAVAPRRILVTCPSRIRWSPAADES